MSVVIHETELRLSLLRGVSPRVWFLATMATPEHFTAPGRNMAARGSASTRYFSEPESDLEDEDTQTRSGIKDATQHF